MLIAGPLIIPRVSIALLFEWRDIWIGVYVDPHLDGIFDRFVRVYICLIPFFPLMLTFQAAPRG